MNDLLSLRSEVKQLSSLLQQLQTFLKSMSTHHPQQHQSGKGPPDGGGGSGGNSGIGGSSSGTAGISSVPGGATSFQGPQTNLQATSTATVGQSARPQKPQQMGYDNKSYHLSPPLDSHSRTETSAQVTPSLGEMGFSSKGIPGPSNVKGKESIGPVLQSDGGARTVAGRFTVTKTNLPAGSPAVGSMGQHGIQTQNQVAPFISYGQTVPVKQIQHPATGQPQQQQHHQAVQAGNHSAVAAVRQHQHQLQQQQQQQQHQQQQQQHQAEMEYVQVDTSYQPHIPTAAGRMMPITMTAMPQEVTAKKGVISQLIDKVRSKDERKKSSASGVSSSSSGGTIPHHQQQQQQQQQHQQHQQHHQHASSQVPPPPPPATSVMARRALSMYDAQCQYGTLTPMDGATSAVAALSLANSNLPHGDTQRRESRPMYSRAKSFVKSKSKSDDERPPSKLSKESRARSAGQLETESLLRSLSTSSKDASRILSLYQGLIERESLQLLHQRQQHAAAAASQSQQQPPPHQHQQQQQQQQQHHPHPHNLHYPHHHFGMEEKRGTLGSSSDMPPLPKLPAAAQQHILAQAQRPPQPIPQQYPQSRNNTNSSIPHYPQPRNNACRPQPQEPTKFHRNGHRDEIDDDYQFLPMGKSVPVSRSQSAPPRKPPPPIPGTSTQQVRVYVHEEPRSTRSSPSATLSKSLEESYLYGYLQQHGGGLTPSSSGGQSACGHGSGQSAFTPLTKKPSSVESLVSISTEHNSPNRSRKSSIDFDRRSVITVKRAGSKTTVIARQHSWEAGTTAQFSSSGKREQSISTPQLSPDDPFGSGSGSSSRHSSGHPSGIVRSGSSSGIMTRSSVFYDDDQDDAVGNTLHKADSFEGHEEAVRSIVAAVQETRSLQRKLQSS